MDGELLRRSRRRFQEGQAAVFAGPSASLVDTSAMDRLLAEMLEAGGTLASLGEDPRDGGRAARLAADLARQEERIAVLEQTVAVKDAELSALRDQLRK